MVIDQLFDQITKLSIGDVISSDELAIIAGVKNGLGLQCGILVNDKDRLTVLVMSCTSSGITSNYPNYWDEETIGILHYCGTNKGLTKVASKQNLNSRLNKAVNEGTYPIQVYARIDAGMYRYLGLFKRIPALDKELIYEGRTIYQFGLVSTNIDSSSKYIEDIIELSPCSS